MGVLGPRLVVAGTHSGVGKTTVAKKAHIVQQSVRPSGKLIEEGCDPRVQGVPVPGRGEQFRLGVTNGGHTDTSQHRS